MNEQGVWTCLVASVFPLFEYDHMVLYKVFLKALKKSLINARFQIF